MTDVPKTMPFAIATDGIYVLIPKKRGEVYLRQPIGPFANPLFLFIRDELSHDSDGLDGYVHVHTPFHQAGEYVTAVIPGLAKFLGTAAQQINISDFFDIVDNQRR
jgi:hypothetical protein